MNAAVMVFGFAMMIAGLALWSIPLGCFVAGAILFVSAGLEYRRHPYADKKGI